MLGAGPVGASILDDFNDATLVADFLFNDASGTLIQSTANAVNPLQTFDVDTDFASAATNGLGQFDGSGKDNTSFGSAYVDLDGITSGTVYALFDVSWNFDELVYDPSQDEEFRVSLVRDDPRSTFITAETYFQRTSATEVTLFGNAVGTFAMDTNDAVLGSSGDVLTLLAADLDNDILTLSYSSDDGVTFTTLTEGALDASRGVESFRFVLNEDFSDDTLLVERIAVAIPEPGTLALLALGGLTLVRRLA